MIQPATSKAGAWVVVAVVGCAALLGCDRTERNIRDAGSNNPTRQIPAAEWLARNPTPDALAALELGMQSTHLDVRVASARAIAATGDARAARAASRILRADALGHDPKVAETALAGMGAIGGPALPDLITVALLATDGYVRALVRGTIAEGLASASPGDRVAATAALLDGVAESDADLYRAAYGNLVAFAPLVQGELVDTGLPHTNRRVQVSTMMAMADSSCVGAGPAIARFLGDADAVLRAEAARSLGALGTTSALPELRRVASSDPVLDVRKAARDAEEGISALLPPDADPLP
ncbi:HEAT repeat domain-containing protein [Candidatus Poribacteria bacterium]|nr:HEAT repeat domain-containing protein [Candidatus Poribacteria bacterium]MBT5713348.1 HEAT repeat domain-containing protein [Candidatus Poribacteria bacterium]MBT7804685.1 HEAT repeat domain-containing protein [Candidatus Poribacteria bacterium]